jgi:DNA-directed RNA polymerase
MEWNKLNPTQQKHLRSLQAVNEEADYWAAVTHQESEIMARKSEAPAVLNTLADSDNEPLIKAITDWFKILGEGTKWSRGSVPNWVLSFIALGPETIIAVALKAYFDLLYAKTNEASSVLASTWAAHIGHELKDVIAYKTAKKNNLAEWNKQSKFFTTWSPKRCNAFTKKFSTLTGLTPQQRRTIGHAIVEVLVKTDGFKAFTYKRRNNRSKKVVYINFDVIDRLQDTIHRMDTDYIRYKPMCCPPEPWTSKTLGGYLFEPLRKTIRNGSTLSEPYVKALNALQNTEWECNTRVRDVMLNFFNHGTLAGAIPPKDMADIPQSQYPIMGTKDEKRTWTIAKEKVWKEWAKTRADRLRMLQRFSLLDKVSIFYHAWFPDFRGRQYTYCELLTPQGTGIDKGLIQFAQKVKQTPRGLYHLKIYIANLFDQDKETITDRLKWVEQNMDMLKRIDQDPYTNREWLVVDMNPKKAAASWERLAAVFELFRTDGMTQLPIQRDGSNNGLQHWAALLNNKELAKLVNIYPSEKPMDIYKSIADLTHKKLMAATVSQMCSSTDPGVQAATLEALDALKAYYGGGISRKVTKRSTMCYPYGITLHSTIKYLKEEKHLDWVPEDKRSRYASVLGRLLWIAMNEFLVMVNASKAAVSKLVSDTAKAGQIWTYMNPLGFTMLHSYRKKRSVLSKVRVWNVNASEMLFREYTDEQSPGDNASSSPPNLIHNHDACHMVMTILGLIDRGVGSLSFIHDSYGVHAPYVDILDKELRDQFINLYSEKPLPGSPVQGPGYSTLEDIKSIVTRGKDSVITDLSQSIHFFG